jgi:hypothetical protein
VSPPPYPPPWFPYVDLDDCKKRLLDLYPFEEIRTVFDTNAYGETARHKARVLDALNPTEGSLDVDAVLLTLLAETIPGRILDPSCLGSDVPWGVLVGGLLAVDPVQSRRAAGVYVERLDRLALGDEGAHVHPVVVSVAHYLTAAAELALGRTVRAARWARAADALVEHESPPGVAVAAYVRAVALLMAGVKYA